MAFLRRLSFQTKLLFSFALVIVLTTVLGYTLINLAVNRAFNDFIVRNVHVQDRFTLQILTRYYQQAGSMERLIALLKQSDRPLRFMLVDTNRTVVFAPEERWEGQTLSPSQIKDGLTFELKDGTTWTLVPIAVVSPKGGRLNNGSSAR